VVVDSREWQLVAEGRSSPSQALTLAIAPGDYRVKRVLPEQLEVAAVTLKAGAKLDVATLVFAPQPLSAGLVKGAPADGDYAQRREWRRGEALSLLAAGEAGAALAIFDEILLSTPDDLASLRGRGRALVRLAEAYDRLADRPKERQSLREALTADPSLSEDPDFHSWYRRLQEMEGEEKREVQIKKQVKAEIDRNPRLTKRFGIGFDLIGTRGFFSLVGTVVLFEKWFPHIDIDLAGPGFGLGARFVPLGYRFSPFVGAGARISAATLGLAAKQSALKINDNQYSYNEIFGKSLHFDVGVQYMSGIGFSAEFALGVILYQQGATGALGYQFWPTLNLGWYF
jgi:tetratricopeptide (TPR) repeat protein